MCSAVMSLRSIGHRLVSTTTRYGGKCWPHRCPRVASSRWMSGSNLGMGGGSYEGDGKTTITIINKDLAGYLLIDAYALHGFRLSNGLFAMGPIALFPSTVLQWDIRSVDDINEKSLSLFTMIEPRLELLLIGVGDDTPHNQMSSDLNRRVRKMLAEKRINCEIMPTKHAVTTYNFMCIDHRVVGGAFIPPYDPDIDPQVDGWLNPHFPRFITADKKPAFDV